MCAIRKMVIPASFAILLGLTLPATSWAEKTLEAQALEPVSASQIDHFETLAANVGWGLLFRTEQMSIADSAYGIGPVLSASASPYTPILFYLESRAWAVERFLDEAGADERRNAFAIDPEEGLIFDILVLSETEENLTRDAIVIDYRDDAAGPVSVTLTDFEVTLEQAMGGDLYAARAQGRVAVPADHDWDQVTDLALQVRVGDQTFDLTWTFGPQK